MLRRLAVSRVSSRAGATSVPSSASARASARTTAASVGPAASACVNRTSALRGMSSASSSSSLPTVTPPLTSALPSDSFQLLPEAEKAGAAEDALYQQQIGDIEAWWATPRYEGIRRPYSAADVVSKRGSQQQSYPSSTMARKLWILLREKEAKGEPVHTSMCISCSCQRRSRT